MRDKGKTKAKEVEDPVIGIIVGDSNGGYASMITYMLFYISMNLGTFACIVLFGH